VTVFESKTQPGGLNTFGIAEYKLKADVALAEVQDILDLGVELKTGVTVESIDQLLMQYDAVFVGVGLGSTKKLGIPGEDLPGVLDALTFIEHLQNASLPGHGGRPAGRRHRRRQHGHRCRHAGQAAGRRSPRRSCIAAVKPTCRAITTNMSSPSGTAVGFRFNAAPQRIVGNGSGVVAAVEVRTSSGTETIPCDMVIVAIGQGERTELTWAKGSPKVFTGGDCANGGAEIVNAAAEACGSKEDPES